MRIWQVGTRAKITFATSGANRMPYEIWKDFSVMVPGCMTPIALVFDKKDAAIIAAAPRLLAALKECCAVPNKNRPDEVWDEARAAIADAEREGA